jgi:hypothetical protein
LSTEHFQTGSKKLPGQRGMAQASRDLIAKMRDIAEEMQPITGRGIGYKLFIARLTASMDRSEMAKVLGSFKLSWLESIMSAYPEIDNAALRVGLCIALALNQRRWAYISTKAISDRTGISVTRVKVALAKLRDHGWLIWKRTGDANVYKLLLLDKNQIDIEARQTILSDRRDEARKTKRRRFRDSPWAGHLKHPR